MKNGKKHYDREFKEQVIQYVLDHPDLPYTQIAKTVRSP